MSALDRKLLSDLWRLRGQVLAIALVLAAATATFVMSSGVHASLAGTRDAYYARNRFAEVFVSLTRAPRSLVARIAGIPGVARAEGRIQQYAILDLPGSKAPARALINSIEAGDGGGLNRITLRSGRMPREGETAEVLVDEGFAEASGFGPGSRIPALIYGRRQVLHVVGTGLAPDFVYAIAPGDLIPDSSRFAIVWADRTMLEAATDRTGAINQVALTLERGAAQAEVIRKVDALLEAYGGSGAYGREDQISHRFLDNELMQLEALTRVIPPVFLAVAIVLVHIVLGRMIRTERNQIGVMKAFGYTGRALGWHYLKFALVIAGLAAIMGSAAGIWMGQAMTRLYADYFRFPLLDYRISPPVMLIAGGIAAGAAAIGALGGMRPALRLQPAVAMAPLAPPLYRAGLLESLGRRAGFTAIGHMIVRHITRWPGRSAVTVLGVALSMGLLFATMQFLDSSRTMLDEYFFRAQRQDMTVSFTEPRNRAVLHDLARIPGVQRVEGLRALPVRISAGNRSERVALEGMGSDARLTALIDADGSLVDLLPAGLMLSRQLADQLGVQAGDSVRIEMLSGRRVETSLPVARIVEEFVGARAYAATGTLMAIARDDASVGSALLRIDPARRDDILLRLKQVPVVLGVTERDAALDRFEAMIDDNMNTMLAFYIAFASAIAVGVVYNSARILFSERAHELATLRVLGYHRSEVGMVLLGELGLLVALSVPFGCIIGFGLAKTMTAMFSSDLFRLPFAPSRASYGLAIVVVLAAASATALLVARRVMALDMVRVLKARD